MINDEISYLMEEFKIPYSDPHCPEDWKDWYHYILFDPITNIRILYNICFNGKPGAGFVTDTFLVSAPEGFIDTPFSGLFSEKTFGFSRSMIWKEGELEAFPLQYSNKKISIRFIYNILHLNVSYNELGISFYFMGKSDCPPIYIPELAPYGKGFLSWGIMADYKMSGWLQIQNQRIDIRDNWYGYHDRNFGRFNWGCIGWTWFVVNAIDDEGNRWTYVMQGSNNQDYSSEGAPIIFIHKNKELIKVFMGETITKEIKWSKVHRKTPVLPGSMASVFGDRTIAQPRKLFIQMKDERHNVLIEMTVITNTELIVPDNENKEFTFIKELSGDIQISQTLLKEMSSFSNGFFYAELAH
jgi:hypothetical protein